MSKKNIGATLSIKDNNFTAGIRNAITGVKNLKNHTTNAMGGLKKMQSQGKTIVIVSHDEELVERADRIINI